MQTMNKLWKKFNRYNSFEDPYAFPQRSEAQKVTPHKKKVHENNIKKMFLLAHMLDQCAPSRAFSIEMSQLTQVVAN